MRQALSETWPGRASECNEPSLTSLRVAGWTAGGWPGGDPDRLLGPRLIYQAIIGWAAGETLKMSIISALLQRFIITVGGEHWTETPGGEAKRTVMWGWRQKSLLNESQFGLGVKEGAGLETRSW